MSENLEMKTLLEAGCHFGHQTHKWNPKMKPYVYGERNGIYIMDLAKTIPLAKKAHNFLQKTAAEGKPVLFVGTKRQASAIVAEEAKKCGAHYINNRWLGGLLTNWSTVQKRVNYLNELDRREQSGEIDRLPKKEAALLRREYNKLNQNLGGLREMTQIPDIVVMVDPKREYTALLECRKLNIPVISILDTNCDPNLVNIPIPANDDAARSVKLILSSISDGIINGA